MCQSERNDCFSGEVKKIKVAVLLAAYNGISWLPEQIESILAQEDVLVTIFVSVDCSGDGTEEWVRCVAEESDRVVYLPFGAHFGGAAPNFFRLFSEVDFSGYDYVSLADQDDIWLKRKLITAIDKMSIAKADCYSGNVIAFWPDGKRLLIDKAQPQCKWDYIFECAGPGCTYVMNYKFASVIKHVILSKYPEIIKLAGHDWFFYAYARANKYIWFIDDWPGMLYRQHNANQTGANRGLKAFLFRVKKIVNGWGIEQSALIAKAVGVDGCEFVRDWSEFKRGGFLRLAFHANQCRRKRIDKILFFFACLAMAVFGKRC